jgi:hypothetical protein
MKQLAVVLTLIFASAASAQNWERIPLVTSEMKALGNPGGEGGQWPRGMSISSDGQTMFLSVDVGGIYRSLDGGLNWNPCNVGYTPRGSCGTAIDPFNPDRVISVGGNSAPGAWHGLYLSTNRGSSWKSVLPINMGGLTEVREQLAFDPTSYDEKLKMTKTVYWSRIKGDKCNWGTPEEHPAIYRSDNGGESWRELDTPDELKGGIIRAHPTRAETLIVGSKSGLFIFATGKKTLAKLDARPITGVDLSTAQPNNIYYTTKEGLYRINWSANAKDYTPVKLNSPAELGKELRNIKVSPVDANRMVLWREPNPNDWDWRRYTSSDGGKTWIQSVVDSTNAFLPQNAREGIFVWHPKNANKVFSIGGDWPTVSSDSGKNYRWTGRGYNCLLIGGSFQFSPVNPDRLFFGSQDYNGAMTADGGSTWKYINPSGNGWGGFTYGGANLDDKILWVGNAEGWGAPRKLKVSRDGGASWTETGKTFAGMDVSFVHPTKTQILFASNLRSTDAGVTWSEMTGCSGVVTASGSTLYGIHNTTGNSAIVKSTNDGLTWSKVLSSKDPILDVAVQPTNNTIFYATTKLYKFINGTSTEVLTPKDQLGNTQVKTVALDPVNPNVMYIGNNANIYSVNNAVCRSIDGGTTWTVLTKNAPLTNGELDGARETYWIRVHPRTRYAWCATSCYGQWKIAPPAGEIKNR